jgi:predicted nuclease with TOPRIM domain
VKGGLALVLKLKERELKERKRKLAELSARLKSCQIELEKLTGEIESLSSRLPAEPLQYALWSETIKRLLVKVEEKKKELSELESILEKEREFLAIERGEFNLLKGLLEKREREKAKREEVLNERFLYQVLYGNSSS